MADVITWIRYLMCILAHWYCTNFRGKFLSMATATGYFRYLWGDCVAFFKRCTTTPSSIYFSLWPKVKHAGFTKLKSMRYMACSCNLDMAKPF